MVKIRPLKEKDKKACEHICIVTAPPSFVDTEKHRKRNLLLYCDYYTRMREHSFVAVNENDEAVGYIFCEPDCNRYKNEFKRVELKKLLRLGLAGYAWGKSEIASAMMCSKEYPGHMHIDILPEYQRQGVGHMLVDALKAHLAEIGVAGIHLGCGAKNEMGISFYKKYGFKELSRSVGGITFSLDINK